MCKRLGPPPLAFGYALLIGAAVLVVGTLAAGIDAIGMVLVLVAALGLVFFGVSALRLRPRLAVHDNLLTVRTLTGQRSYPPEEVYRIRVLSLRHIGRRSSQLELDLANDATTSRDDESRGGARTAARRLAVSGIRAMGSRRRPARGGGSTRRRGVCRRAVIGRAMFYRAVALRPAQ